MCTASSGFTNLNVDLVLQAEARRTRWAERRGTGAVKAEEDGIGLQVSTSMQMVQSVSSVFDWLPAAHAGAQCDKAGGVPGGAGAADGGPFAPAHRRAGPAE